ncbi:acyl-CoA carboxylase subunit epsilon [Micromonospora sp. WMMD736]|uniref:acyl-CoA carboxylase subunit epsilon n=1 Tax=Micromonospora sp. WMMD736 TaxID=3404112 RepID=UPI003B93EC78
MSGASDVIDEAAGEKANEPHIKVLKGSPRPEELAALIAVLGTASGGAPDPGPVDQNLWGHPVDKLRYELFSWQRITLLERTHMRR